MKQDDFFEQMAQITKAHAYDIVCEQRDKLFGENKTLNERVKFLEDLINEYTTKMMANLLGGKVDEFLKEQLSETDKEIEQEFKDHNDLKNLNIF